MALGVLTVPVLVITVALETLLEVIPGVSLRGFATGIVSGDDIPFLVVARLLSVAVGELVSWWRQRRLAGASS